MTDTASVKSMTGDQGVPKPVPPMGPHEALALYLYLKDNTEGWREPGKTMLLQAWQVIRTHAQFSISERSKALMSG